jgi:sigma-B regulation protein RsbU (phosphoserine phosphatase)
MISPPTDQFRTGLLERRERLATTIVQAPNNTDLQHLLLEVDRALDRLNTGRYGICEVCNEQIDEDRLQVDPLLRSCPSHLASEEQVEILWDRDFARQFSSLVPEQIVKDEFHETDTGAFKPLKRGETALPSPRAARPSAAAASRWSLIEALKAAWKIFRRGTDDQVELHRDIARASLIQSELLPASYLRLETWEVYYDYASAGPVGGDYCDLIPASTGELFLFFGDAMGKGIAASMIASRLHAVFRTLLDLKLPIDEMLDRANHIFCECVLLTGYYATLVCCRASSSGTLELINAGHVPPLLLRSGGAERLVATGTPLGLFYASKYEVTRFQLAPGETLLFYTDGVTEARNDSEDEYGCERLIRLATGQSHLAPKELVQACRDDVSTFTSSAPLSDDLTLLAMRRV